MKERSGDCGSGTVDVVVYFGQDNNHQTGGGSACVPVLAADNCSITYERVKCAADESTVTYIGVLRAVAADELSGTLSALLEYDDGYSCLSTFDVTATAL